MSRVGTLFLSLLFLLIFRTAFADYPVSSFQTNGDIEISALDRYGIRVFKKKEKSCSYFYKENPSSHSYSKGLEEWVYYDDRVSLSYRNALFYDNHLMIVVDAFQNEKLISTTVDVVDPNTLAISYSFEWPGLRSLTIVKEGDENLAIILSENEIEMIRTDFTSYAQKIHAIPLPAGQTFQECVVSHSYRPSKLTQIPPVTGKGETERRYVVFISEEGGLSLWKISAPLLKADRVDFISTIATNDRVYHISLGPSEERSEPKECISVNSLFSALLANNEIKTEPLRELLHRTISERNRALDAAKRDHLRGMEDYQSSFRYAAVKSYEAADSFFREFIPFDDDLIPTLFNCYVTETNSRKMLDRDLHERGLLEGFRKGDSERFSEGLAEAHSLGDKAGLSVLLFPAAKARSIYSGYRRADSLIPEKIEAIEKLRSRTWLHLATQSTTVKAAKSRLATLDRLEQFYRADARRPILLRILRDHAPFAGKKYNTNIIKMYPKIMITTNLVWGLTELYRQIKDHGWEVAEWNEGQMTYNCIFINVLTSAIVVISGYRMKQVWKTAAIVGIIDGLSPAAQAVENRIIHHDPNRPYDSAQALFDKLFIAVFALPKSQANIYLQPKAVTALRKQGYGRWAHEYAAPYGMNALNEGLGTGGYTVTVSSGNDLLNELILPAIEFDQADFENFLKDKITTR